MGKCYNSIVVNAPIDKVWDAIKDFHDGTWAKGVLETVEKIGDIDGTAVGAKRVLNGAFHETLQSISNEDFSFTYSIDDGPGPVARDAVNDYIGSVQLSSVTANNTTFVEWSSTYQSADDSAVGELCNPIYHAVLGALANNI